MHLALRDLAKPTPARQSSTIERVEGCGIICGTIDPSVPFPNLALPAGHPFLGVPLGGAAESTGLWTGTTCATDPTQAYTLDLIATGGASPTPKTVQQRFWCVRGGGPVSVY
jgi:hypothetical protein